jgi:hypothetical protein
MPASTVFCALRPLVNRYIALADHIIRTNPASLLSLIGRLIRSRFRSWEWGCKRKRLCGIFRMLALHAVPTSCPNTSAISQLPQPLAARRISAACWSGREERIGSQHALTGYYLEDGHLSAVAVVPETAFANFATSAAEVWIRSAGSRKRGEPSVFVPLAGSLQKAEAQWGNSSTAASATVTIGSGRMNRHSNAGIRATAHI